MVKSNIKIIGITGAFGSGKSTASDFFEEKGFKKLILSEFLEKEARKRGFRKITRKILQDIGNEFREKFGGSILAQRALDEIEKNNLSMVVIDGIRNPSEVERLRASGNFMLLAILSGRNERFERLKKLKRRESLTWELFDKLDKRDAGVSEKNTGLHVDECIKLADYSIENNNTKEEFQEKLETFFKIYAK